MSVTAAITANGDWNDGKRHHVIGSLTFSGSYSAGGDTLDFGAADVQAQESPLMVQVPVYRGYIFEYVPGTLATNGKLIIRAGTPGAAAFSTLTSDATTVVDGDTVTIGGQVYTFKTALTSPATANQVLIGATAAANLVNLKAAINADPAGAGTLFGSLTVANASVVATTLTATTLLVVARVGGTIGNAIATTTTATHLSWTSTVLVSGVNAIPTGLAITAGAMPTDLTTYTVPFYAIFQQLI